MQPFFARPPFGVGAGASRPLVEVDGEDDRWRFRLDGDEIGEEGVPGTNEGLPVGIWGQGMSALCGRGRLGRDEAGRFRWETWTGRTRGDLTASFPYCLLLSARLAFIARGIQLSTCRSLSTRAVINLE